MKKNFFVAAAALTMALVGCTTSPDPEALLDGKTLAGWKAEADQLKKDLGAATALTGDPLAKTSDNPCFKFSSDKDGAMKQKLACTAWLAKLSTAAKAESEEKQSKAHAAKKALWKNFPSLASQMAVLNKQSIDGVLSWEDYRKQLEQIQKDNPAFAAAAKKADDYGRGRYDQLHREIEFALPKLHEAFANWHSQEKE